MPRPVFPLRRGCGERPSALDEPAQPEATGAAVRAAGRAGERPVGAAGSALFLTRTGLEPLRGRGGAAPRER